MANRFQLESLFAGPRSSAVEPARVESSIRLFLVLTVLAASASLVVSRWLRPEDWWPPVVIALALVGVGWAWLQLRRGELRRASSTIVGCLIAFTTLGLITEGMWSAVQGGYMLALISAGLLLGVQAAAATLALCGACLLLLAISNGLGLLPDPGARSHVGDWWMAGVILTFGGVLLIEAARRSRESLASLRQSHASLRRSNQELRASRDRFEALAEHAQDLVSELDKAGRFLYVNHAFHSLLGFTPGDLTGREFSELAPPAARAASMRALEQFSESGSCLQLVHALHRDGSSRYLETSGSRYRTAAGELRTTLISRDVTLRIEAQERMRELEERVARAHRTESLGLLAGGIAHDFNNLLVGILANAEEAMFALDEDDPARECVQSIARAGEGAAQLVRQLLSYTGRGRLEVQPIDLSQVAQETARMLRVDAGTAIEIEVADGPVWIRADASQIRQVVLNLLVNALESLDEAGSVRLRTCVRTVDSESLAAWRVADDVAPGEHAILEVRDTGRGMSADTLAHVFDPFYTTKPSGQGLGLSTVLDVVRSLGGALDVTSELSGGTTVRVLLPALDWQAQDAAEVSPVFARSRLDGEAASVPN